MKPRPIGENIPKLLALFDGGELNSNDIAKGLGCSVSDARVYGLRAVAHGLLIRIKRADGIVFYSRAENWEELLSEKMRKPAPITVVYMPRSWQTNPVRNSIFAIIP